MQYQKHALFCYFITCFNDNVYIHDPVIYTKQSKDDNVAQTFVEMPEMAITRICKKYGWAKMKITHKEQREISKGY